MRSSEENNEHILNPKTIKRLKYVFYKQLRRKDGFDDFYHDYVVHILSGHGAHQTFEHFGIDWLRESTFYNRKTKSAPQVFDINSEMDFSKHDESHLGQWYRELVNDLANKYFGRTRIMVFLYYLYGLHCREIGFILNLTEGRISQMLTMVKQGRKCKDHIPDDEDIGIKEQREIENLRFKNRILSNKLAKAFREKNAK